MSEPAEPRSSSSPASPPHRSPALLVPVSVAVLALVGAGLLVAGEFTPLLQVKTADVVMQTVKTGPHHAYAQLLIAVMALAMAGVHYGTGRRAPLLALAVLGAIALLIGILHDLPDTHATGVIGVRFEGASASARAGLGLELAGGASLLAAALVGVLFEPRRRPRRASDRRAGSVVR